jgi:Tol biopolymer transport system component
MAQFTAKRASTWLRYAGLLLMVSLATEAVSAQEPPAPFHFVSADSSATAIWPVFSPDGTQLLFSQRSADGFFQLFVIPASGGTSRRLLNPAFALRQNQADWRGPAGLIAFAGGIAGKRPTLWITNAVGSSAKEVILRQLSDGVYYPSWYPRRKRILIVTSAENLEEEGGVLRSVNLETGIIRSLTNRAQVLAGRPHVSPVGGAIAFAGQRNFGQHYDQKKNKVWILEPNRTLRELDSGEGRSPAWSPDGRYVAFESDRGNEAGLYAIYVVPRNGGTPLRLTPFELDAHHPTWSPDGRRIAFDARILRTPRMRGIAVLEVPSLR